MNENTIFDELRQSSVYLTDAVQKLLPSTISKKVQQAWDSLSSRPEERRIDAPFYRLSSLGKHKKEAGDNRPQVENSEHGAMAAAFAAAGTPFSLTLCTGRDQSECDILLQAEGMEECSIQALADGMYGSAQLKKYSGKALSKMPINRHLLCTVAMLSDKELERPAQMEASWLARTASALAGKNCRVQLIFSPVSSAWLHEQTQQVIDALDYLSSYQKNAIQISTGKNFSYDRKEGKAGARGKINQAAGSIKKSIVGEEESIDYKLSGDTESASRTYEAEHYAVLKVCEVLKQYLNWLDWLRRSGAWSVSAWINADLPETFAVAERIVDAAFVESGFRCDQWEVGGMAWATSHSVSTLLPINKLGAFFTFPQEDIPGFRRVALNDFEINLPPRSEQDMSGAIGHILWNNRALESDFALPRSEMNRHVFICGMTGSGKSTTLCTLLKVSADRLPFMVIEPVKGEYRKLKGSVPDLQICTMEAGSTEQLRINPFWFPEGGSLQYHIDSLRAVIASAFELTAAMPNILEQCLNRVYINLGWNIALSTNIFVGKLREEMLYPTFDMLCREIDNYIDHSNYAEEIKSNYKGAMSARLKSFTCGPKGLLLNQQVIPPLMQWQQEQKSCVIELEALADDADKAIVMGMLLSQYFQCVKQQNKRLQGGLRHVIVLEEAHHLFKEAQNSGAEDNMSRKHLVELLSNMLAEIRAYGEGVFIVDQSPTSISPQVIKNTAVKIVHRVDYGEDLKTLQHALLLSEKDLHAPAHLACGTALIRYGAMNKPIHVSVNDCADKNDDRQLVTRGAIEKAGLSAQNLLELVQNDSMQYGLLGETLSKFMNHLLFDDMTGAAEALCEVQKKIRNIFGQYGVDEESACWLTTDNFLHILNACVYDALTQQYPAQYLLRGKLQMMAERYLELQLGRMNGIRPREWQALRDYCQNDVYPLMANMYRYGTSAEHQRIAEMLPSNARCAMSGIVVHMIKMQEALQKDSSDDVMSWSARKGVNQLCRQDFVQDPVIYSELWRIFKMCKGNK